MKIICALIFTTMLSVNADDLAWLVLDGDMINGSAKLESHWGWCRSPEEIICKKFLILLDKTDIKGFRLHYKTGYDPYDPETRTHSAEKLGNVSIFVNDKLAVNRAAGEIMSRGWHMLELEPSFLKTGENTLKFTLTKLVKNSNDRHYGIFYMAIDNSQKTGRSSSSSDGGKTFNSKNLRAGTDASDDASGEFMIAIELGLDKNSK